MKIIHFADLHLGVETYGHTDPDTGLSTRLLDFLKALDELVEYAIGNGVDLVLFCGDAYKSREPTQTQQREFARRIRRLSESGIPVFLLVGNHDLPATPGRATATEIFATLAVANVTVSSRPDVYRILTRSGTIQLVTLPWPRRSTLLTREDTKSLDFSQLNQKVEEMLTGAVAENVARLDNALPAILAGHVWVIGAKTGTESAMTIGREHMLLPTSLAYPALDYVALGHIHRHQVISENPPTVYAGSLERLDFGDEEDSKGFYVITIEPGRESGKRRVRYEFHTVAARRFLTINAAMAPQDTDPTATVLQTISEQKDGLKDAVVRLSISLPTETAASLRDSDLREALKPAHFFTITRDVQRETRTRLGSMTAEGIAPLDALKMWLESQKLTPEYSQLLLEYGERLLQKQGTEGS